jgi:hypothetical protein
MKGSVLMRSAPWIPLVLAVMLLAGTPSVWAAKIYVLRGGDPASDEEVVKALQERGHTVTWGVEAINWDGYQAELRDFQAVVILYNFNYLEAMPKPGLTALANYISGGGRVVTGEWFHYQITRNNLLPGLLPVGEYCGRNSAPSTTYTQAAPDAILNKDLPSAFSVSLREIDGTESCLKPAAGATVFYSSSNGGGQQGAAGVVGWDSAGGGRLISFSTLLTVTELQNAAYRKLFVNAVDWALFPGPRILTGTLPPAVVGSAYSQTLAATGGTPPYNWSADPDSLPPGLVLNTSSSPVRIVGTPTTAGSFSFAITITDADRLSSAKTFTLSVLPRGAGVEGKPCTTKPANMRIEYGDLATCTIDRSGNVDTYRFDGSDGEVVSIAASQQPGGGSGAPCVELITALTGQRVAACSPARIDTPLFEVGTHTIRVYAAGNRDTLSYALSLERVAPPSPSADRIRLGESVSAQINPIGDVDLFAFSGVQGTAVSIAVSSQQGTGAGDPCVELFDSAGERLGQACSPARIIYSSLRASNQSYAIRVSESGSDATMSYTLDLQCIGSCLSTPGPIGIVTTSPLPGGAVNVAYAHTLVASGGKPLYNWTLISGSLPTGLRLSLYGVISGTPTALGTSSFTVRVTDSARVTADKVLSLTIGLAGLTVTTPSPLPTGTVGTAYSQTLAAEGGNPPYRWAVAQGTLPAGLSLSAGGVISGTPTSAGLFSSIVQVTDSSQAVAGKTFTITIFQVTPDTLPGGIVGTAYTQTTLGASGGRSPYTWTIASGSLPAGLSLTSGGVISGTPTSAGLFSFIVRVTDSAQAVAGKTFTITIFQVTPDTLPSGIVGTAYTPTTLSASGGKSPYTWAIASGSLPGGLSLSSGGVISGTPTAGGAFSFTVAVTDSAQATATKPFTVMIVECTTLAITTRPALPSGMVGGAYRQELGACGGRPPYTWTVASGTLPGGLSLAPGTSGAVISGTPTAAGAFSFTVRLSDSAGAVADKPFTITIFQVTPDTLPSGIVGTAYIQTTLGASGGRSPYTWTIASGSLPGGLTLTSSGVISGTPTAAGAFSFTVRLSDSAGAVADKPFTITVFQVTPDTLPGGIVGAAYTQTTLTASGGRSPYTWTIAPGSLPAGLTLTSSGVISGTPTAAGAFSFTVRLSDSAGAVADKPYSITIFQVIPDTLPSGIVGAAYTQTTLTASGGRSPYTWTLASGPLPGGLTLTPGGVISGTPTTAGVFSVIVRVTDSSQAAAGKTFTITIFQVTPDTLPGGIVGAAYTQTTLGASGGRSPYTWTLASGSLPAGLTLTSSGVISGTPTTAGIFSVIVRVTDSAQAVAGKTFTITIFQVTPDTLPSGIVGTAYTQTTLSASGGWSPYTWTTALGSLPGGLTLTSGGVISGIPTTAGLFSFTVQVTDSSQAVAGKTFAITIFQVTPDTLPSGMVGTAYTQTTLSASGGKSPYTWVLASGPLPGGLTLTSGGVISGIPTTAGAFSFTVRVTDSAQATAEKIFAVTIFQIGPDTLPSGIVGIAYTPTTLSASGGRSPYTWAIASGLLPGGLTLTSGGVISGTPTTAGAFPFTVRVSDTAGAVADKRYSITISQVDNPVIPDTLPGGMVRTVYSQTLTPTWGRSPYTWAVASGSLPGGLSLSSGGVISGTPTTAGTFAFTVRVTDSSPATATKSYSMLIVPQITVTALSGTVNPAQQPTFSLSLSSSYSVSITGELSLSFVSNAADKGDDETIIFVASGNRTITFTVSANAQQASFPAPGPAFQAGTTAGTITLRLSSLQAGGASIALPPDPLGSTQVNLLPPAITSAKFNRTASGFDIVVVGYSTPREMVGATFQFTAASGKTLDPSSLTADLKQPFAAWYGKPESTRKGSQFTLTVSFAVSQGSSDDVSAVSVTLANSRGNSQPTQASR